MRGGVDVGAGVGGERQVVVGEEGTVREDFGIQLQPEVLLHLVPYVHGGLVRVEHTVHHLVRLPERRVDG